MIGIIDTLTLARTKLRSKRILLAITILVSGLLFGILAGATLIITGASNSVANYFNTSINGHYLVMVTPNIPMDISSPRGLGISNPIPDDTLKHLKDLDTQYVKDQQAIHKKNNLPFDPASVVSIFRSDPLNRKDEKGEVRKIINFQSPMYTMYVREIQEQYVKTAPTARGDLKRITSPLGATEYYIPQGAMLTQNAMYLAGGKEDLTKIGQDQDFGFDYSAISVLGSQYQFANKTIAGRFVLPENAKRAQNKTAIPVVLSTNAIVKTFGKELAIPNKPTDPSAQVTWMSDMQQKINGHTYQTCWRSPGEITRIQEIMRINSEIADNKNNKEYVPPALQYTLPSSPCGAITIAQDKRTMAEKKIATTTEAVQKELGTYQPINHELLTFQVVGVMTTTDMSSANGVPSDVPSFLSSLLGPQYGVGAFVPDWLYDTLPADAQHATLMKSASYSTGEDEDILAVADIGQTVVSFPNIESARTFINGSCPYAGSDCKKDFAAQTYGANYLLTDTFSTITTRATQIALPVAVAIATVIIWITMARVIIDSRRETAVFRALGAKRRDIASIYLVYSLIVALFVVIFMLVLGLIIALVIDHFYSGVATDIAMVAYGSFDTVEPFRFIGLNLPLIGGLVLCVFIISLVAALPPLLRNVRRNPIRDMRDE